jgi:hypothetical protein
MPKRFLHHVDVLNDVGQIPRRYVVVASSEDDAMQVAFALDGGWSKDRNAEGLPELAKAYCYVVEKSPI